MTTMRRRAGMQWLAVLLLGGLLLATPGGSWPGTAQAQPKELRVGVALSLSGIFSRDAALLKEVYDLWAETVNQQGGLKLKGASYPVRIIYYDDESAPQKSAQLVERLATSDKVDLILGAFGSSIVFAASAVAEKYHYPYIEIFPVDLTDYNSIMLKVKRANPDVVLVGGLLVNSLRAVKAAREVDFTPKGFAFSYGPTVPEFVKELAKDAEGAIAASEWLPSFPYKDPVFGSAQAFADAIQKKYGHPADYVQAAAAGGLVAQQAAIETLALVPPFADKDREALMELLHRQDIQTLYGRVKFGPDGGILQKVPIAVQIQSGKFALVYPKEVGGVQAVKLVYPLTPWRSR